jgi:hypothetical protein
MVADDAQAHVGPEHIPIYIPLFEQLVYRVADLWARVVDAAGLHFK